MPRVIAKPDTLNELNTNFNQSPLQQPVFLNSVPKCGTHLIRNIFRMFVPVAQQYHQTFIQIPILHQHSAAFAPQKPMLSWGHLLFSDDSAIALRHVPQIVVVRDPYDWVLARARFFLSDTFQGSMEHLKGGKVSIEEMLNMMIFGIYQKAPTLHEIFTHNAVAWLGTGVKLVRYEDIVKHLKSIDKPEAEAYFRDLLSVLNLPEWPKDWKERILTGSDRKQSGTYRENLAGLEAEIPDELPLMQKQLVEYAVPGLRHLLGYY
ncbi:MAG: hypothetical protein KJ556_09705 [Gammaproteobacteria bacterium]|nr:hypothetical protein [Gammaproteobacteria bacterium]MBU2059830.1 hypothetical protein [Gammaproteobacteria bacterium]MBU2175389.1 hypothetical protein [Gammaproteobacteria bacterium]MBU2245703.1 hypothetical protein [Gammaproteobacteria bacterium]MBU2345107.1 hypothetical protein [Gammaproteobacteria bacterium]